MVFFAGVFLAGAFFAGALAVFAEDFFAAAFAGAFLAGAVVAFLAELLDAAFLAPRVAPPRPRSSTPLPSEHHARTRRNDRRRQRSCECCRLRRTAWRTGKQALSAAPR